MAPEFPNMVEWYVDYLKATLPAQGYPTARVGDTYKGSDIEVWVQRDGGPQLDQVREAPRIRINVYYKSSFNKPVDDLAARVSTLVRSSLNGDPVDKVRQLSGPTNIADTLPRRYMLFEVFVRGSDL